MQPKRKSYSPVFIVIGGLLVIVAAYYCAGGMYEGATIFEWQKRMRDVMAHPFAWYLNAYTGKTAIVFLFMYILAVLMYITSRRNYLPGREMGSAKYADVKKVNQKLADLSRDPADPKNIAVMRQEWGSSLLAAWKGGKKRG